MCYKKYSFLALTYIFIIAIKEYLFHHKHKLFYIVAMLICIAVFIYLSFIDTLPSLLLSLAPKYFPFEIPPACTAPK